MQAVEEMRESNPMMGLRGCRLSIVFPGIVEMQTRAILQAAAEVKEARQVEVHPGDYDPARRTCHRTQGSVRTNLETRGQ